MYCYTEMTLRELLTAMKTTVSLMKGKPGDVLVLGEHTSYLVASNNYVRYTHDSCIPEYRRFEREVVLVDVLLYLLSIENDDLLNEQYEACRVPGLGLLVYGATSVSGYIAETRYKEIHSLLHVVSTNTTEATRRIELDRFDLSEQWEVYKGLRTSDGAKHIAINNYIMYLFNGLIPVVKDDQVKLTIYDNDKYNFFTSHFEITKYKVTKKETKRLYTYNCIVSFYKL